ncbi:MAG TPA: ribose 5-phosphate isomerase B [Chitinophagaceae bacterium]|nr:ribose 5-phosphate isomerase B [Chitinophagaceae bacterium]
MSTFDLSKPIALGGDHAGFEYKTAIAQWLQEKGYQVDDKGVYDTTSADYPDYAHPVANAVEQEDAGLGILVCGSANGVCMTANKHQGIRAALCWQTDVARLARQHNNANVICIPARFVALDYAKQMVEIFLETAFEGGRHAKRVGKIAC